MKYGVSRYRYTRGIFSTRCERWADLKVAVNDSSGALTFHLLNFMTTGYYQCWDYYRINKIVVKFMPTYNVTTSAEAKTRPVLYGQTVIDLDDNTKPPEGTKPPFSGYSSMKTWRSDRVHTRIFRPKTNIDLYNSTGRTEYGFLPGRNKMWLDTGNGAGIPHYGLKYWMAQPGQAESYSFRLCCKIYVSLREFHDPGAD